MLFSGRAKNGEFSIRAQARHKQESKLKLTIIGKVVFISLDSEFLARDGRTSQTRCGKNLWISSSEHIIESIISLANATR